ncbi:HTH domain-containing protein [Streptomyces sp. NPDC048441]
MSAAQVARELDVSRSTAYRTIQSLLVLGNRAHDILSPNRHTR